ncbi:hypothetical protein GQ55_2G426700 [Panicum hallii var. hallii]|uniref:Uncharacterized protein n=1 Tax=Panicum hallii var. hallii TaxID=1504633 RepID=A0A2T7EYC2_9POAL|nr:hypothetical protein GQ55_2G426700 [Panicum hallii var. hallii]
MAAPAFHVRCREDSTQAQDCSSFAMTHINRTLGCCGLLVREDESPAVDGAIEILTVPRSEGHQVPEFYENHGQISPGGGCGSLQSWPIRCVRTAHAQFAKWQACMPKMPVLICSIHLSAADLQAVSCLLS